MSRDRNFALRPFARIFAADAIVRTAYQMGKTPVLPLFAAMLGASDILLGLVVSVSTLTGIVVKPIVGFLSDRQGRRIWLLISAGLFIIMPFAYPVVRTPEELFALRLVHGLATAIFGPVSLALVAEMAGRRRATRLGVFGLARSVGYLLAPVSAAFLLTHMSPQLLFMLTGIIAAIALVPLLALEGGKAGHMAAKAGHGHSPRDLFASFAAALNSASRRPAIWVAGSLEMMVNMAAYAVKAFLPLHILAASQSGHALILAGLFFTVQEGAHMLMRTPGGMVADRYGRLTVIGTGVLVMAGGLFALPWLQGDMVILGAVALGAAQGLVFPASLAFVADQSATGMGTGMGLYGAMRNLGKVLGPVIGGIIMTVGSFDDVLVSAGSLLLVLAGLLAVIATVRRTRRIIRL
ncbi:MAG: MFS transporter [Alphaproteobacteria bacterium]|nr:MFS transporter [Alphaproteobacteria bacterium]